MKKQSKTQKQVLQARGDANVRALFKGKNTPVNKNQETKIKKETSRLMRNMGENMKEHVKIDNCMSAQAVKVVRLMDDPFNAPWDDAKMPYYPGGQPLKTIVTRAFGTTSFTAGPTTATQILWMPNPASAAQGISDPQVQAVRMGATIGKGIPGCPPFSVANAAGSETSGGPHCGYIRTGLALEQSYEFQPTIRDSDQYLGWNTVSELGEDSPGAPGLFAYRLVAAAIRLTPTSTELNLGGLVASARIAESTNTGYQGTTIMMGNSSAHFQRGSSVIEMKYIRSADDDSWNYPSVGTTAASAPCEGLRHLISIIPPADATTATSWTAATVAFYEVKGVAAKILGTPSYQQPDSAGKIATTISHLATTEVGSSDGSHKREFEDMSELVNAKESPATGKLASGAANKKSFINNISDFISEVAPIAEKVAMGVLPMLL